MTPRREPGQVTATNTALFTQEAIDMMENQKNDSVMFSAVYCALIEIRDRLLILESNSYSSISNNVVAIK